MTTQRKFRWRPAGIVAVLLGVMVAGASCAPGTDGIILTTASADEMSEVDVLGSEAILVQLPHIPVIGLPDLSEVGQYDELLREHLGSLVSAPLSGISVVTAECQDGELVYSGDASSDVFEKEESDLGDSFTFEIDSVDGSAHYFRDEGYEQISVKTSLDGSGEFIEQSGGELRTIEAFADGSGRYFHQEIQQLTTVDADANGSGVFYRKGDGLMTVTIRPDGAGQLYYELDGALLTIDAGANGAGEMFYQAGDRVVTVRSRENGSWEFTDEDFSRLVSVLVRADGTGQYRQRGAASITLDFDADGNTIGPQIILPDTPRMIVSDRFPILGTLAPIQPPCVTIIRFDSQLLFAVDQAIVKPEATEMLDQVAAALQETGNEIDINGHTDANGSDEYNLDLSQRRAEAVEDELRARGVDVNMTVTGFGESQPVAPNYNEDGSDDEAGQAQNRRVELVLHE